MERPALDSADLPRLAETALRNSVRLFWPATVMDKAISIASYTKSRKWRSFLFRFRLLDRPSEDQQVTLTYGDEYDMANIFRRYYSPKSDVKKARPKGQAHYSEDEGWLAEVFPSDWKLPCLPQVLSRDAVLPLIASASNAPTDFDGLQLEMTAFRYRPHRRSLIRYTLSRGASKSEYIGKLFASDNRARGAWQVLTALQTSPETRDLAPKPVALEADWQFVLMERLPGHPLPADLGPDGKTVDASIAAAAHLLAGLHRLPFAGGTARNLESEILKVEERLTNLSPQAGGLVKEIAAILAVLRDGTSILSAAADSCFIHGDFNPRQVLIADGVARVVDLDSGSLGDPALDAGRFMAALRSQAVEGGHEHLRGASELFLREYSRISGHNVASRAALAMALRLLNRAERLLLTPTAESFSRARALVGEASQIVYEQANLRVAPSHA